MPFALITIGLIMIVTGAKDTYSALGKQLVSDFTGPGNFTYWIASIGAIGSLGYIENFRTFSRAFMALIIVSMILSNRGFFSQLSNVLASGPTAPQRNAQTGLDETIPSAESMFGRPPTTSDLFKLFSNSADDVAARVQAGQDAQSARARENFGTVMNWVSKIFMPTP